MRRATEYETYLRRMRDYYRIKHIECPSWVDKAIQYYNYLYYAKKDYGEMCSNTALSKRTMEHLSHLEKETLEGLPAELVSGSSDINTVLIEMYNELISNKDVYFINEWTLSKIGRHKMREFTDRIPSVGGIMPPENEFTNVPDNISFSNRIYSADAEYDLTITLGGSRICVRNGNRKDTEYIDFTEGFLDRIIPMAQWENFKYLLRKKDRSDDRDESVYQDFKTVLVDINWNEYDLDLRAPIENDPFIDMLKLVWDEYSIILMEKGLVLPWFNTLGWVPTDR